jgi:lipoic acid synthetase
VNPGISIEVLTPDFRGVTWALDLVIDARPDVFNHNTETVPRLYQTVRPQAKYTRSLDVIAYAKGRGMLTKSGLMLGLGETLEEVEEVMKDLHAAGCDLLTLGQYLQPSRDHLPVARFVTPEEFSLLARRGLEMGFRNVQSGPLVRSSYHAEEQAVSPIR